MLGGLTQFPVRVILLVMDWGQVITIIFGIAGFMSIFMFLINKRIDDLRHDMDRRFSELKEET